MAAGYFQYAKARRLKYSKIPPDNVHRSIALNIRQFSRVRYRRYVPNMFLVKKRRIPVIVTPEFV